MPAASIPEVQPFIKKQNKIIDCIRVDGASDEGPSHLEVQYYWTKLHLEQSKVMTLVTTRHSGGSYLNRVELMNGGLSIAHSNMFIPSTLHGSNFSDNGGGVDENKLQKNLETAAEVYINRVNGATPVTMIKGVQSNQTQRQKLLTFLKSTK